MEHALILHTQETCFNRAALVDLPTIILCNIAYRAARITLLFYASSEAL